MYKKLLKQSGLSALLLAYSLPALAAPIAPQSFAGMTQHNNMAHIGSQGNAKSNNWSMNLNLSSSKTSTNAAHLLNSGTVHLNVGGANVAVSASTNLTPAEKLAVIQVLQTGQQTLLLNGSGAAYGGSAVIGSKLSSHLNSINVPANVTVIDLAKSGALNLKGSLQDFGTLYLTSNNAAAQNFSVSASEIVVGPHAVLSTALPSGLFAGQIQMNSNLSLSASGNISNAGSIISSGALNLSAAGKVSNNGADALIQAANNVTLSSGTGQITNTGLISSGTASINLLTSAASGNLAINAFGGTFQALQGDINIGNAAASGSNNLTMNGGDYFSQNLNLNAGTGVINGIIGKVSGNLNSQASVEHLATDTPVLKLCNNTISGDPTFVNVGGDIVISGLNTFAEDVAILASGNITSDATGSLADPGSNITLVAGAGLLVSPSGGANLPTTTISGSTDPNSILNPGESVAVNFSTSQVVSPFGTGTVPAAAGGNVDLSSSAAGTIIDSSVTGAGNNGGNIVIAAVTNTGNGGKVLLDGNSIINTSGGLGGSGGSVSIFAGADPGSNAYTIKTGQIFTGPGGGGTVTLANTQPVALLNGNPASTVQFDSSGAIGAGQSIAAASVISSNAGIQTGDIIAGGTVNVLTGSSGTANGIQPTSIVAAGSINITGYLTLSSTAGTVVPIISGQDITISQSIAIASNTANAPVFLVAGAGLTLPTAPGGQASFSGGSTTGGAIQINGNATFASILTNAGDVTAVAYKNSGGTSSSLTPGTVTMGFNINTGEFGPLGLSGGNVTIIAGQSPVEGTGTSISLANVITEQNDVTVSGMNSGAVSILAATPVITGSGTVAITNGVLSDNHPFETNIQNLTATNAGIQTGAIETSGSGSTGVGGNGGNITILAGGAIGTGGLDAYGGGGSGGTSSTQPIGFDAGPGGTVTVQSVNSSITISGNINTSGGGGGGGHTGSGIGGDAGNITISAGSALSISGVVLAASGGDGGVDIRGGGGGGSLGGGGGGAGGNGQDSRSNNGGAGGSGVYGAGGGGGASNVGQVDGGGGDGGGGGFGSGPGGDGGGFSITGGGNGGNGGGSVSNPADGASYPGSAGQAGSSGDGAGGHGGSGGNGSPTYGVGGLDSNGTAFGGNAGTSTTAAGGQITLTGATVSVTGALTGGGPFSGQSIVAQGVNSSVSITSTGKPTISSLYQTNADYAQGAPTAPVTITSTQVSIPNGSTSSNGGVTINSTPYGSLAPAGTYAGNTELTIKEGIHFIDVSNGDLVTPAEYIALVQVSQGTQSLTLNGSTGTTVGSGFASGGSFAIDAVNGTNFGSLNLPESVTMNVNSNVSNLNYSGAATVFGSVSFSANNATLNVNGVLNNSGDITFNGNTGAIVANGSITGGGLVLASTGSILLTSVGGNIAGNAAGTSSFEVASGFSSNTGVSVSASAAGGVIYLQDPNAEIATLLSSTSQTAASSYRFDAGGSIVLANGANLFANTITLNTAPGNSVSVSSNLLAAPNALGNGGTLSINSDTIINMSAGAGAVTIGSPASSGNGGTVAITTTSIQNTNNGSIQFSASSTLGQGGSLSITSTTSLTIGSGIVVNSTGVNGGKLSLSSGSGASDDLTLSLTALNFNGTGASGNGGSFTASAGRNIIFDTASVSANGNGTGNGGTISLSANGISFANSGTVPLQLSANSGASGGNAGLVSLSLTSAVQIGTNAGQLQLSATGSGTVNNSTHLPTNGVNVTASGIVVLNAGINVTPGAGTVNGGNVVLNAGLGNTLNFSDTNTPTFNGSIGGTGIPATSGGGNGSGGLIILSYGTLQYNSSGSGPLKFAANGQIAGGVNIFAGGAVTLGGSSNSVNLITQGAGLLASNGTPLNGVNIQANGIVIANNVGITVGPLAANFNGGNVVLQGSQVQFDTNTPTFNGQPGSTPGTVSGTSGTGTGNGGYLSVNASSTVSYNNQNSTVLTLTANGGAAGPIGGNGGTVIFDVGAGAFNLSTTAALGGTLSIHATGGTAGSTANPGAAGGTVVVQQVGNFTVAPAAIVANPLGTNGAGATIVVEAGYFNVNPVPANGQYTVAASATPAKLLVSSAISANGVGSGHGGSITLGSNSATAFDINQNTSTNTNGIKGAVSVLAGTTTGINGSVSFLNGGGAVSTFSAMTAISQASITANGNISLGGALGTTASTTSNTSSITLDSTAGNVTATSAANAVSATSIVLEASGNIGTSITVPLTINEGTAGGNLAASATGAASLVNVNNTGKGNLTLGTFSAVTSAAGATFSVSSAGGITTNDNVQTVTNGSSNILSLKAGGNLLLNGNIATTNDFGNGTINLTALGTISQGSASDTISAANLALSAGTGAVGGLSGLTINATGLSCSTTGAVSINNLAQLPAAGSTLVLKAFNSTNSLTVVSAGPLTVSAPLTTESSINLNASANNLTLESTVGSAAGSVTLSVSGNGNLILNSGVGGNGILSAKNITLNSANSIISGAAFKLSATGTLSVNVSGAGNSATIQDTSASALTLGTVSTQGSFTLQAAGAVTVSGVLQVPTAVNITGKAITINSAVGVQAQSVTISGTSIAMGAAGQIGGTTTTNTVGLSTTAGITGSSTSIIDTNNTGTITLASTGAGAFGASNQALDLSTANLSLATTGLVNINNNGTATLALTFPTQPAGAFTLVSNQSMTVPTMSATSISLSTTSNSSGSIILQGNLGGTKTTTMNLTTGGSGTVIQSAHSIQASNLSVNSFANINLNVDATVSLTANSTSGSVNLNNTATTATTLNSSSSSGSFAISTAGATTLKGINTVSGSISVTQSAGALTLPAFVVLAANNNNNLTIKNTGTLATATISVGNNAQLSGQSILLSTAGPAGITIGNSANLSATNGNLAVNAGGATLSTGTSAALTAKNGSLTLSNAGTASTTAISIGAGSQIQTTGNGGQNVNIFIGATLPVTPVLGVVPAGVKYLLNGMPTTPSGNNGPFFFGTSATSSITVTNPAALTISSVGGGSVLLSTGALPKTAIKIAGNTATSPTLIQADPPISQSLLNLPAAASAAAGAVLNPSAGGAVLNPSAYRPVSNPATNGTVTNPLAAPVVNSLAAGPVVNSLAAGSVLNSLAMGTSLSYSAGTMTQSNSHSLGSALHYAGVSENALPVSTASIPTSGITLNTSEFDQALTSNSINGELQPSMRLQSAAYSAMSQADPSLVWVSETELGNGQIPAKVASEIDFGVSSATAANAELAPIAFESIANSNAFAEQHKLSKGSMLLVPKTDSTYSTAFGTVQVKAGSTVLILSTSNGMAVYDFDDNHRASVVIFAGDQRIELMPGMSSMICSSAVHSFEEVNPAQLFAYRNLTRNHAANNLSVFSAEFFVPGAMQAVVPLKEMLSSSNPNARRLTAHMLKTIAAYLQVRGKQGRFEQLTRPSATAWVSE